MKAQISFFIKVLFVVSASIAFILLLMLTYSFRKETIKEREISDFKLNAINILQKLVSSKECLAYEVNGIPQKGIIDINKLRNFISQYREIEPICAKAFDFDYNVKIIQFPREVKTYSIIRKEKECQEDCYHRGYACKIICHQVCREKELITPNYTSLVKEMTWSFGLPLDSFSPEKAKWDQLQLSLPISIKYNETFVVDGVLYLFSVRGELERLYSSAEYLCQLAEFHPSKDIKFSMQFSFSFPINVVGNKLCMLNACKKFICSIPTNFKEFKEGEYIVNFIYNSTLGVINIY
jgi:hypothetical protein